MNPNTASRIAEIQSRQKAIGFSHGELGLDLEQLGEGTAGPVLAPLRRASHIATAPVAVEASSFVSLRKASSRFPARASTSDT